MKKLREFEEIENKAVEVTVNSKEEDFCLYLVQEFSLCSLSQPSFVTFSGIFHMYKSPKAIPDMIRILGNEKNPCRPNF